MNHNKKAIKLGVASIICTLLFFILSVSQSTNTASTLLLIVTFLVLLLNLMLSFTGLFYAAVGFKEKNLKLSMVAIILNLIFPFIFLLLLVANASDFLRYFLL